MAAAVGSTGTGQTNGGVTTVTSSSLSVNADSIILVSCAWDGATFNTISTTKGSTTLTLLDSQFTFDAGLSGRGRVYLANTTTSGSGTFTFTTSSTTSLTITAIEITGLTASNEIDTSVIGTVDTSAPFTGATITPSAGQRLLVALFFSDQQGPMGVNSPWTKLTSGSIDGDADSWGIDAAYYLVTADGSTSYTPTFTDDGGAASTGLIVLLSMSSPTPPTPPTVFKQYSNGAFQAIRFVEGAI
jgi:hypothetical protein